MTQVSFGFRIVKMRPGQEKILMKLSELVLLKKLGLSVNFPLEMLHARKLAHGVDLMKLSVIIIALKFQLYFGHARSDGDVAKIIRINTKNESFQCGHRQELSQIAPECKLSTTT